MQTCITYVYTKGSWERNVKGTCSVFITLQWLHHLLDGIVDGMVGACYQYCDVKRFYLTYEAYHIIPMIKPI